MNCVGCRCVYECKGRCKVSGYVRMAFSGWYAVVDVEGVDFVVIFKPEFCGFALLLYLTKFLRFYVCSLKYQIQSLIYQFLLIHY